MQNKKSISPDLENLRKGLLVLNERLTGVEESLSQLKGQNIYSEKIDTVEPEADFDLKFPFKRNGSVEFRVGEYGMAWLGNIVLLFGITFLVQYLQNSGIRIFSILAGFISVAGIYTISHFTRTSYSYLSKLFTYNGHLLLYYMVLQLHFFQTEPIIDSKTVGLIALMVVVAILLYITVRKKSQTQAGIVLLMLLASGVISNSTPFLTITTALTALITITLYYRFAWIKLVFLFIFLVYLTLLNWLLNNPLLGNTPQLIESPGIGYFFFFTTGFIFSLLALVPKKDNVSNEFIIVSVIWNWVGFSILLLLTVVTYFTENYVPIFSVIAAFCIVYSILLQSRSLLKITASMYALYGFFSLSVAFYGIFGLPEVYALLSIQSLLVVSMALWFRSKFIVVMNSLLYISLMVFYILNPVSYIFTDFTFMLVAFITARVINGKKERLNIKTELLRDLYLISGLIMTLITFYHAVPTAYISGSWIFVAILFFVLSHLIKNVKYRWLAIATMLASAIKLIFIDMSDIDIGYRVLVFLALAIISIIVSILYTKFFGKKKHE